MKIPWFQAEPSEHATCFWATVSDCGLRTQARKLKTLRHPNVLVYLDSVEVVDFFYDLIKLPVITTISEFQTGYILGHMHCLYKS